MDLQKSLQMCRSQIKIISRTKGYNPYLKQEAITGIIFIFCHNANIIYGITLFVFSLNIIKHFDILR